MSVVIHSILTNAPKILGLMLTVSETWQHHQLVNRCTIQTEEAHRTHLPVALKHRSILQKWIRYQYVQLMCLFATPLFRQTQSSRSSHQNNLVSMLCLNWYLSLQRELSPSTRSQFLADNTSYSFLFSWNLSFPVTLSSNNGSSYYVYIFCFM